MTASSSSSGIDVVAVFSAQRISRSILLSSLAVFAYDHLLLFPRELEKVWKGGWSPVKVSYLTLKVTNVILIVANLITNFDGYLSDSMCRGWNITAITATFLSVFNNQWLLFLRVDACYNRRLTKILMAWLIFTAFMTVLVTAMFARSLIPGLVFIPVAQCVPTKAISLWAAFANVPYMIFEITMFCAMVWQYARNPLKDIQGGNALLHAIFHNSAIYFFLVVCIAIITSLLSNLGPTAARGSVIVLTGTLGTSSMCRSILNLRSLIGTGFVSIHGSHPLELSTVSAQISFTRPDQRARSWAEDYSGNEDSGKIESGQVGDASLI